jgi:hypothetical protein
MGWFILKGEAMQSTSVPRARARRGAARLIARGSILAPMMLCLTSPAVGQSLLWEQHLQTPGDDVAVAVITDGKGGAFVTGYTSGDLAGPNAGASDVWLARFDGDGTRTWINQFGTGSSEYGLALAPDGSGGFFAAGSTYGALAAPNAGQQDIWLARYDADGSGRWIVQYGTPDDDIAYSLATDGAGGVYVAGWTSLARFDESGSQLWSLEAGNETFPALVSSVAPDVEGGVFVGGGVAVYAQLARFNRDGVRRASSRFLLGIFLYPFPWSMIPDGNGGLLVTGWYGAAVEAEPGGWVGRFDAGGVLRWSHEYTKAYLYGGASDGQGGMFSGGAFFARYGVAGNQLWTTPAPTIYGLAADGPLAVWVAGSVQDAGLDAVVSRYGTCYANCDGSTASPVLSVNDFLCFQQHFAAGDSYANCDQSTTPPVLNIDDFLCFQSRFVAGCSAP